MRGYNFFYSIKGRIITFVVVCMVAIIAITATINSIVLQKALNASEKDILVAEAESNSDVIDLDPTTRSWWIDAVSSGELIYTAPYKDFASGKMIVSIAVPFYMEDEQAVVLADITIDSLIEMVKSVSTDETVDTFLLADDGSVVIHANADYLIGKLESRVITTIYASGLSRELQGRCKLLCKG